MRSIGPAVALTFGLSLAPLAAVAQPGKVYRIGYVSPRPGMGITEEAFRQGLRELGYQEGQNLVIEWRFAKGKLDMLPELAAELVRLNVDCILAVGVSTTRAAKRATTTIPIVMGSAEDDPVRHGLVASLARPGGNVTGAISIGSDLAGKRLELLKEVSPRVTRVAILYDPEGPGGAGHVRESEAAAPALRLQLQPLEVRGPEALEKAFQAAVKGRADALVVVTAGSINTHRTRALDLVARARLPAIYNQPEWVRAGGLMSYSSDPVAQYRRAASYVDRILKGANPADLPVEQPTKFDLVINRASRES